MQARIKNMRDQLGIASRREFMYCTKCGSEYSANKGDYFMVNDPDYAFKCCNKIMFLMVKHIVLEPYQSKFKGMGVKKDYD